MRIDYAERARALVGTRFRPQGRDSNGIDCVGVALATYAILPGSVRRNYAMRGDHEAEARASLCRDFRRVSPARLRSGDLLLIRVAVDQVHFGVRTGAGFVHAHAGLRRVVETPGMPQWPLIGVYRKREG